MSSSDQIDARAAKLRRHLNKLKTVATPVADYTGFKEQVSIIALDLAGFEEADLSPLFDYRIFPENILVPACQWQIEDRPMREGDTIAQKVFFPPRALLSLKMVFGVRIVSIIDLPDRKGFSYVTLPGHAEKGISTFTVENFGADGMLFRIHTLSRQGSLLSRIFSLVTRRYQAWCTARALRHFKQQVEVSAANKP